MNVTLRQLRALAAVAEAGSFTDAARRLHLTQAAMSVLVRELENELGVRMLDRTTRHVRLTSAGEEFLPSVLRVLNELTGAVASISSLRDKHRGRVGVAAPPLMACTLMPYVLEAFHKRYPGVTVNLVDTMPEQTLERLMTGGVEIAIGLEKATSDDVNKVFLFRDSHLLVCRPDHPLANKKKLRWRDVMQFPFIAPTRDFVHQLSEELASVSVNKVVIIPSQEVSFITTALGMVAAGLGITACPSYASDLVKGYKLQMRPLTEPVFSRDVNVYSLAAKSLSPAATSFCETLLEVVTESTKAR